jgi:hypothetical protein
MGMLGTVLMVIGAIGMLVFGIQILILAFKTSIGWGLASLLIPFVIFFYVAKNWQACRTPFLRWLACLPVYVIGMAISFWGAMSQAGG